jgi:uncharacterized membrane protein
MDTPEMIAAEYLRRDVEIDIGGALSRGWALVMANLPVLAGATVLAWAIGIGLGFLPIIGWAAGVLLGSVLHAGVLYMFIRRIRGEEVQIGDMFAGFNVALVPLILAGLLCGALTAVGTVLCILPGIYLAVSYLFVLPLVIDKKLDFWPAMEVSRQVVTKHWWSMFLFAIVLVLIVCLGALACGLGLIIAMPVVFAAAMYVYEDLFGTRAAVTPVTPVMPVTPQVQP